MVQNDVFVCGQRSVVQSEIAYCRQPGKCSKVSLVTIYKLFLSRNLLREWMKAGLSGWLGRNKVMIYPAHLCVESGLIGFTKHLAPAYFVI